MTCLVLIILTVLMVMKVRKKRRLAKKILPSTMFSIDKEQVKIQNSSTMETISARGLETSYHRPGGEQGGGDGGGVGGGGSTVVTQLSHDSSVSQPQLTSNSVPASHSTTRPRRLPSEGGSITKSAKMYSSWHFVLSDCVPSYLHQLQSQRPGGDGTPRQYSEVVWSVFCHLSSVSQVLKWTQCCEQLWYIHPVQWMVIYFPHSSLYKCTVVSHVIFVTSYKAISTLNLPSTIPLDGLAYFVINIVIVVNI